MREYIFCSVIESPQIARRSPFFRIKLEYSGAFIGWNFEKEGLSGFDSKSAESATEQPRNPNKKAMNRAFEKKLWPFGSEKFWRFGEAERRSMPKAACD